MNKDTPNNIRLGIFVTTGIVLFILGLYYLGSSKNMFGNNFQIYTSFDDVNGLSEGNNVRYLGIDIGTVEKISIINDSVIKVEMSIDQSLKNKIRKNSTTSIGTDGLMGNKIVIIDHGTSDAPLVSESDEISSVKAINTEMMLRTLENTNLNVAVISQNLRTITENINQSRGTLYAVLMDTVLAKSFRSTVLNIESLSKNLNQSSKQVSSIIQEVNNGHGTLGVLLKDTLLTVDLQNIVQKIKQGSEHLNKVTNQFELILKDAHSGKGTISYLLKDPSGPKNINNILSNVQSASIKINEDLEALKHNFLFKSYFKKQEKIKLQSLEKIKKQDTILK